MPSGNNEYGSKAVLPRDRFTIHILYSFFTEKPRPSGRGFFVSILIHSSLAFSSAGMISSAQMHPQLAFLCRRDYFRRPDSSLSCSFPPQGLLRPPGFIPSLLFGAAGIISSAQMHLYLALFFHRDYFRRPDSSLSCSFSPQGLLLPPGFISILLFFSTGIIATARIHPQLAFLCRRDDFFRSDASLSCSFSLQGLLLPPGFISILFFSTTGIISAARIHPQLALFLHRDYFFRPDSSPACFFVPQGLFLPLRCISILLFPTTGIIATARIHPYLALFLRRDDFFCSDASPACSFPPQGLFRPPGFISILLFSSAGITSSARIHPQLAFLCRRDYFFRPDSSLSCSSVPQGLFPPPRFISILLFFSAGIISDCDDPP